VSSLTQSGFFAGVREGKLTGLRCTACGALAVPPKAFCEACGKLGWETVALSGDGVVESFTVIRVAPRKFTGDVPYAIAAVRLAEGVSLLGRVVDTPVDEVTVGMAVKFRPIVDDDRTAISFVPA
jgi:uncharacterized OB-fold protein